jgi:hypothetical protein
VADVAAALAHLAVHGWARLGRVAADDALATLRARADALMTGGVPREGLFFQHDSPTGAYEDLRFGDGWIGPSPAYRKIEGLERDDVVRGWIAGAVARAVLWTKAAARAGADEVGTDEPRAGGGTALPWHQDGGRFWGLSAQPTLTMWTALDDAPVESGCVEVIPGTHLGGLATPEGGTIPAELTVVRAADVLALPAVAGEVLLLHNLVWHRSGRNRTGQARRALSVCYMSASITCLRKRRAPRRFLRPWPDDAA